MTGTILCLPGLKNRKQHKGAIQLDLFIPYQYGYAFKVTNKSHSAKKTLTFHNGRGANLFNVLRG